MPQSIQQYFKYSPFFSGSTEMSELAWEKLQDKIERLAQSLASLLTDAGTAEFVESLTQKYQSLSVQGPDVARLIRDVVIGDVFVGDMPKEISGRLGLDPVAAREVANLIVSQLFAPVIEELKQVHREKFPGRLPAKPSGSPGDSLSADNESPREKPTTPPISQVKPAQTLKSDHYPGEELPESGGNIIDLRNK